MLNWIVRNRTDYLYEMDLALNKLQSFHKNAIKIQTTNRPTISFRIWYWRFHATNQEHDKDVVRSFFCMSPSWSKFFFMTMFGHMFPGWHCRRDMRHFHIHLIFMISHSPITIIFQAYEHFFTSKNFCFKEEVESAFKGFLVSKHLILLDRHDYPC